MTNMPEYEEIVRDLSNSYDSQANQRESTKIQGWKEHERQEFLIAIGGQGKRFLELGSGSGRDGKFFQDHGFDVVCIDNSQRMVDLCQQKGLQAYKLNFFSMRFPEKTFDVIYSLNALLHVPKAYIRELFLIISSVLSERGMVYLGLYGGTDREGIWEEDVIEPKRFFSFFSDQTLIDLVYEYFEIVYFRRVLLENEAELHFQSLILQKR